MNELMRYNKFCRVHEVVAEVGNSVVLFKTNEIFKFCCYL